MRFYNVREDIDRIENKDQVTLEDIMKITSDLGLDIMSDEKGLPIQELPVSNPEELSGYLRRWAQTINVIIKKYRGELMAEKRFSKLEQLGNYLDSWDCEMEEQMSQKTGTDSSISDVIEEYDSDEEKMKICHDLQLVLDEHLKQVEDKNGELLHEKKKLAINMLRID